MKKNIVKELEPTGDLMIRFTDEELAELGWEKNELLSIKVHDDGVIEISKMSKIDIELSELSRDILEFLIKESCEKHIPVDDIMREAIRQMVEAADQVKKEKIKTSKKNRKNK